jgi:hypothetical protein
VVREGRKNAMLKMPNERAEYHEPAWWRIGQSLREYFEVPAELPPKLLTLVGKLDAIEGSYLLRYLDANA